MRMVIPASLIEEIVNVAKNSLVEVCGLLFGRRIGDEMGVLEARMITNRLHSSTAFEMDPVEMIMAIDEVEERGLELAGIFHSHLECPPVPSERDLEGMNNWRIPWLIITPEGEMRAWVLREKGVDELNVEVTPLE